MFGTLMFDVDEHVCTMPMNRPHAMNGSSQQMWGELVQAFRRTGTNRQICCVILTGAGSAF